MAILSSDHVKMTSLLEKAISVIAPHRCIVCGDFNNVICTACTHFLHHLEVPRCVLCTLPTVDWRVCAAHDSALERVYVGARYEAAIAALIKMLKFKHIRAAAPPLAVHMAALLPSFDDTWAVVAVPTAPGRIRLRGYDQAELLAREVAKQTGLSYVKPLGRAHSQRQVGATRTGRFEQAQHAFEIKNQKVIVDKSVLIVDDVCTTGASLSAAAAILKKNGAIRVWAVVAAWQPPTV